MNTRLLIAAVPALLVALGGCGGARSVISTPPQTSGGGATGGAGGTSSDIANQVNVLWDIKPGLGAVMLEMGHRYSLLNWAGNNGKWFTANYQLEEAREAMEVGETVRPNWAPALKAFEQTFIGDESSPAPGTLKAILLAGQADVADPAKTQQHIQEFKDAYAKTVAGCNGCHATAKGPDGRPIGVVYRPDPNPPADLSDQSMSAFEQPFPGGG